MNNIAIPKIGEAWPEQGGVYVGARLIGGITHHRIMAGGPDSDVIGVRWLDLADADKFNNWEMNGFTDWQAPDREDALLAFVNTPEKFDPSDWYWSSTRYGENFAWAFSYGEGFLSAHEKTDEFRVRLFRSVVA